MSMPPFRSSRLKFWAFALACLLPWITSAQARDREIHDADTLAWWHTTEALSNDAMQGRDTGSAAYGRAAQYVAARLKAAGLKPAGEAGSYFQTVPMQEVKVEPEGTSFTLVRDSGPAVPLAFLEQITIAAARNLHGIDAPLVFRGFCGKDAMGGVAGKVVVCFGTQRAGLPGAAERSTNVKAAGAVALVTVDDPYFTLEPPRWPYAYARLVTAGRAPETTTTPAFPVMRLSAACFPTLLQGSGQNAATILKAGGDKQPLPSFDLPARLRVTIKTSERAIASPNVLAVLPGTDPKLKDEYVVIAAHLDGYGFGTPVAGDNLYNGTLDDAAYVALLIQFADNLKALASQASVNFPGKGPRRSILFCAFTGEEKGLLGSNWFVANPTVPIAQMAADINLDQLRPLFPLKILTALAVDDSTLGATARDVGRSMSIELRPDAEPERGLLRRADHYPFLKAGVPAIGFIFGYDPGTDAERRYREWYEVRYHRPQDDLTQPVDFAAAAKFDQFFYRLVETVADQPTRPVLRTKF